MGESVPIAIGKVGGTVEWEETNLTRSCRNLARSRGNGILSFSDREIRLLRLWI